MTPIEYMFKDQLFRMRLRAYYDMPKFNDEHDMNIRYKLLNDVALTYGVLVMTVDDVMFVCHNDSTHVLSVTRYKVDEYEMNSMSAFYSENYKLYLLPEVPEEVNNVLVKYRKGFTTGGQDQDQALLH